uniref:glutathione transferase n=1 Tax=Zonotrichia albicollis TaxID=44394 RepID=A0A8D2MGS0_ZONAL
MSLLHGEHFPHFPVRMRKVATKRVVKHWNRLPKEVVVSLIDMYVEGMFDLNELLMEYGYLPPDKRQAHFANMMDKTENRYFPAFEKVLKGHGKGFLVGNQLSRADVQLLEVILMAEEYKPDILAKFPLLQSFKARISNIPTIKKFLQPGSQRKPLITDEELPKVMKIFY